MPKRTKYFTRETQDDQGPTDHACAGAHGGISVGPDGATHQSLEEISLMAALPNMHVSAL